MFYHLRISYRSYILESSSSSQNSSIQKNISAISSSDSESSQNSSIKNSSSVSNSITGNKIEEIKDKKTVTQEGITAEIPAGTIITAGDGKDLLSKEVIVDKKDKKEVEAKNDEKEKLADVVFELGNPEQHIVFSKPVKVEVPVTTKDKKMVIGVKHNGQPQYSTDSIVDENGKPKTEFDVINGKVTFYTLGASSFTVTSSTGAIVFTNPVNGGTINQGQAVTGTGSVNGATVNLANSVPTNIGTATVAGSVWSVIPTTPLPLGSNTICANASTTNWITFTVVTPSTVVSPGGVSNNLGIWVKSDQGLDCATNACDVTKWITANTAGTLNQIGTALGTTYKSATSGSNFNYQPAVNFAQTLAGMQLTGTNMGAADRTVCAVHTIPSNSAIVRTVAQFGYADDPFMGYYGDKQMLWDSYTYAAVDQVANTITPNKPTLSCYSWKPGGKMDMGLDGKFLTGAANTHATTGTDFNLGYDSNAGGYSDETVAEAIVYKSLRTGADFAKVESYLASKYGITLDQSVAKDYIASNGDKIFDATAATTVYDNNITVIGRDDISTLNTKQSVTVNTVPEALKISRGALATDNAINTNTFLANQSYLAVSDNNLTGTAAVDTTAICPVPGSSTIGRTNREFFFHPTNYSQSTRVSADWLSNYYSPSGPMYMIVADDANLSTNKIQVPMIQNGADWYADYTFSGDKYVAFIGSSTIPNLMTGDKEINWLKKPWNGGSYLPGTLGWGPGTMTDIQGDTTFTMKVLDPGNTSYAKSVWSGYPSYYPLSYGDTLQWVGLDTGTPDTVTFEIAGNKTAKSASFMIHGIDKYYYNDTLKVEGFLNGSPVSPKLTDYSGYADSVSVSGNTATGTDYWGWRWGPYGDVKANFNSPVDKILVTYKPSSTYSSLWWQEFSIGNIKFKGAQPAPTYSPADGVYLFKEVSPTTVELGEEQTIDFTFQNTNCTNKTINFSDVLPNGTYVRDTLIGAPAGTVNAYSDTNTLTINNAVVPPGITNMSVKIKATAIGNYLNQATFSVGANNYTSDLESTATANDKSPYNVIASTKLKADINIIKSASVATSLQNGIIEYTYTIVNNGSAAVPTVDIEDTLSGAQRYVTATLVNPLTTGLIIGNNGATPPAETYGNGSLLSIKGATIPVGTTVIKVKANVNAEPVGNVLKNKVGFTVLAPTYQALHKDSNETNVTIINATTPNIIIGANVLDWNAGGVNTGIVGDSYCSNFTDIAGSPGCGTTVTLSGQNNSYNEYRVVISTDPIATVTNTAYAFSTDNVCNASDTWVSTPYFLSTSIGDDFNVMITDQSHNGQYICAKMDIAGTTVYKASTWQIKVDRTDPVVTITDNGNTAPASSDLIKIAVTDAGGNVPTESYYRLVSTPAACTDITKPYYASEYAPFPGGVSPNNYTSFLIADGITFTNPADNGKFVCIQTKDTTNKYEAQYGSFGYNTNYNFTKTVTTALNIISAITSSSAVSSSVASSSNTSSSVASSSTASSSTVLSSSSTVSSSINSSSITTADTTAPSAPTVNPVKNTDTTVTGKAEPGSTVKLVDSTTGNPILCTNAPVIADASGNYSCTLSTPLPTGTIIKATATDPAGNVSAPAQTTVVNATTASTAPTVNPINNLDKTITGTGTPGATVNLVDAVGTPIVCTNAPVIVNGAGQYTCNIATPLAIGTVVKAIQTEPGKTASTPAQTTVSNAATTAPSAPTLNPTDGSPISGTGTPGNTVSVKDSTGNPVCTPDPVVAANGTWSCIPAVTPTNGALIKATQTNPAGQTSGPATTTVDQTPPVAPVCTAQANKTVICTGVTPGDTVTIPGTTCTPTPATSTGTVTYTLINSTDPTPTDPVTTTDPATNTTASPVVPATAPSAPVVSTVDNKPLTGSPLTSSPTKDNTPTITGSGTPSNTIKIKDSTGSVICTTTIQSNGTWSCTPTASLTDGTKNLTVTETNLAGSESAPTPIKIIVDTTSPIAPVCTSTPNPSNGTTAVVVTCTGVEPNAILSLPGTTCVPTPASSTGTVVCTETAPGTLSSNPVATVTDPAGNSLPVILPYTKDTTPPVAPTCTTGITNTVTCAGVTPGDTVTIPGTTCTPTPATSTGTVVCIPTNPSVIPTGPATTKDPAGNTVTSSVTPPGAIGTPSIATVDNKPASSTIATPISDNTPTIKGTGSPNDNITVKDQSGNTICTATVQSNGAWLCTPTVSLLEGNYNLTATASNPTSGIASTPSTIAKITIDTTAPAAPVVTSPITGTTTTNPTPTFVGNGEVGAKVTIKDEAGNVVCTTIVPATSPWTCPFTVPQTEGKHAYLLYQTDLAGNSSANSAPVVIIFDIDTDSATLAVENAGPNAGDSNGDGVLDSNQGNVATKPDTANNNFYTSLDLGSNGCNSINNFDFTPEAPLATQDINYDYPIGLFIFKVKCSTPGETLNITFVLDKVYNTSGWLYRKYNSVTQQYMTLPGVTYGTRLVGGVSKTTINFTAVEGGPFDEDGIANGVFSDPSGPTIVANTNTITTGGGTITIINSNQSSSITNTNTNSSVANQNNIVNNNTPTPSNSANNSGNSNVTPANTNDTNKNIVQQAADIILPRTGGEVAAFSFSTIMVALGILLGLITLRRNKEEK